MPTFFNNPPFFASHFYPENLFQLNGRLIISVAEPVEAPRIYATPVQNTHHARQGGTEL